jgi:phosphoglycolate phosphatase-like HAD superfamily hydrolase
MIKAFIFDIDGTLVDSNDFHARAWERAFAGAGKSIPFKKIRPQLGKGSDQLLPEFLDKKEIAAFGKKVADLHGEIFKREYLPQVRPFSRVRELFKAIRNAGARIALASSSQVEEVAAYRVIADIDDLVEKSTSADDAKETKPAPDIFHSAMNQLGNPAHDTVLVVGDTPYDAIAAVRAKLPVIGVLCGGFSAELLRANGCRAVYQDPEDVLNHLPEILEF